MNGFQRFIAQVFRIRQFAAAKSNTAGTSGWRTSTASADAQLWMDLSVLINRSWDTYYNNASIYGALQGMVDQVVGDGIRLQSKVSRRRGKGLDLPLNQEIEAKFDEWASNALWCDVAGKLNFYQMQNLIFINCKVAGGILVRIHTKALRGSPVALALELIDIQQLADNLTRTHAPSGNEIRMGVEIDRYGYPVAYWILDKHPGDIYGGSGNYNPKRYPAKDILHIFNRDNWRPGQTRGVPATAPILITARNLQRFNHYELVKAAAQSAISWVRTRMPDINQPIEDEKSQAIEMADGMVYDLLPGEDLKAIDASSPNPNAPEFTKDHQRQLAKGLKISAYQVTGDLSDANYGSLRVGLLNDQLTFKLERGNIATDFNKPIFRLFMDLASLSFLKLPGDFEVNKSRYLQDNWVGLPFPWIDPSKDVKARTDLLAAGLTTKTQILKEQGWEYEDFAAEKAQEKAIDEKYGLTDQAAPDQAGAVPNDQTDPNQAFAAPMEGMTPVRALRDRENSPTENEEEMIININLNGLPIESREINSGSDRALPSGLRFYYEGMTPIPNQIFERAKNCTTGQACGDGCISKNKVCRKNMPPAAKPAAKKAVKATKAAKAPKTPKMTAVNAPANDVMGLVSAFESKDFATVANLADQIYESAKTKAQAKGGDFYNGIRQGNNSENDYLLSELYAGRGFDKKPSVVSNRTIDKYAAQGELVAYRSMGSTLARFDSHFKAFKTGDYMAGHGIYGHGTYVAFAEGTDTKMRELIERSKASMDTMGYGSAMMKMSIKDGSTVVKMSDLQKEIRKAQSDFSKWKTTEKAKLTDPADIQEFNRKARRTEQLLFGDAGDDTSGRFAVIKGYDAIKLNKSYAPDTYMLLLNRGALRVAKDSFFAGQI